MASDDSSIHSTPNSSLSLHEGSVVASKLNELASCLKFGQWAISTPAVPSNPTYLTSYNIDQTHFFSEGSVITKESCSAIKDLGVHEGDDLAKGVDLDELSSVSNYELFSSLQQSHSSYQSEERRLDCLGLEKNLSATGSNTHVETTLEASSGQHECIEFQYSQEAAGASSENVLQTSRDWRSEARFQQARNEAKMRYNKKKKTRTFSRQIRYASRKAAADTRRRVKGRFVKAWEAYDYDPLVSKGL